MNGAVVAARGVRLIAGLFSRAAAARRRRHSLVRAVLVGKRVHLLLVFTVCPAVDIHGFGHHSRSPLPAWAAVAVAITIMGVAVSVMIAIVVAGAIRSVVVHVRAIRSSNRSRASAVIAVLGETGSSTRSIVTAASGEIRG